MERYSMRLWFKRGMFAIFVLFIGVVGTQVLAQEAVSAPKPGGPQVLSPQHVDNLVAPIALFPDPLLAQVLVACTYPVELVEAQQWLQTKHDLHGQQLMDAARQQNWDASVQALVAIPEVLTKLTEDIRWTTDLGNAFLAQQTDVMNAVQHLRTVAQANDKLKSSAQETVTTANQSGQPEIEIQAANPQMLYMPNYDPNYVWGPPDWGSYPALSYPPYGYGFSPGIDIGLYFGGWGGWDFGGWGWGWGPNWFGNIIFVNNSFCNRYRFHNGLVGGIQGRTPWAHDPVHRLGVAYPNSQLSGRFGADSQASRIAAGRSGNWHGFGESTGKPNSIRASTPPAGVPNHNVMRSSPNGQSHQSYQAPMQRFQGYPAPPRMSAPHFGGGFGSFGGGHGFRGGGGHGGRR